MTSISVLGLGASGEAAAQLALKKGGEVYVSDLHTDPNAHARAQRLREGGAVVDLGGHDLARILASEIVVASPGIPPDAEVLRSMERGGRRWISEPEFAVRFFQGPLIAITGTNGKTTVAALTAHLLRESGFQVGLGGNIGGGLGPAASQLAFQDPPPDWYVLELSSFQLAAVETLTPSIGVLTNLAPDHLDRYPSVEAYYADKAQLFKNAGSESRWVLNQDDALAMALPGDAAGARFTFSLGTPTGAGAGVVDGHLVLKGLPGPGARPGPTAEPNFHSTGEDETGGELQPLIPRGSLPLLGRHNVANALAAAVTARLAGAGLDGIRNGLQTFSPLPHRLEPVADAGGVLWVNDSKATNVAAARSAVESLSRPLVLLLGGKDKGEAFAPLAQVLPGRARLAVLYGEARGRLARELEGSVPLLEVSEGLEGAVAVARRHARSGDVVLLAPACSSFDLFPDYQARGERFRELTS
ncbi:MAG: UDP-N-acetylmuramoyl-L-alanine--D-glutamate ligase [Gemmatimonadota bacterium]